MAAPIGALRAELSASAAQFESDMKRAKEAVRNNAGSMQSSLDKLGGSFDSVIKSLFSLKTAAVAAAGVAGLAYLVKGAVDTADKMYKLSQSAGLPIETLSTLSHAANLSGVNLDSLGTAISRLSRNMMDATKGTGEAHEAFAALGIEVKNSDGALKSSEQIIGEVANKFSEMEDGAGKTALAMKMFGRAGADMIPMLNLGAGEIKKLQQEARDLGITIDTETGQAAERFNDNLTRLNMAKRGLANMIMKEMLPALEKLTNWMVEGAKESGIFSRILNEMKFVVSTVWELLSSFPVSVIEYFRDLRKEVKTTDESMKDLTETISDRTSWNKIIDFLGAWGNNIIKVFSFIGKSIGTFFGLLVGDTIEAAKIIGQEFWAAGKMIYYGLTFRFGKVREAWNQLQKDAIDFNKNIQTNWNVAIKKIVSDWNQAISEMDDPFAAWERGPKKRKVEVDVKAKEIPSPKKPAPLIEEIDKIKEAIDKQIETLRMQALTFNMSEKAATLWKLALQGATPAQRQLAGEILDTIEIHKAHKKALEDAAKSEQGYIEATYREIQAKEDQEKAIWKQVSALQTQLHTLSMTAREAELYRLQMQGASDDVLAVASSILNAIASAKEFNEAQKKAQKIMEEVRTPFEKYIDTIREISELLNSGLIDWETYMRAAQKAGNELGKVAQKGKGDFEELKQVIEGWGRDSAAAIVDFAMTGKMSFTDLVNSMIKDFMKMIIYQNLMRPAFGFLGTAVSGYIYPTSATVAAPPMQKGGHTRPGAIYQVAERGPEIFREGNKQFLLTADRSGYITPVRAMGGDGVSAGGWGEVNVNVINQAPSVRADVQESENGRGNRDISVIISEITGAEARRYGSPLNQGIRSIGGRMPLRRR